MRFANYEAIPQMRFPIFRVPHFPASVENQGFVTFKYTDLHIVDIGTLIDICVRKPELCTLEQLPLQDLDLLAYPHNIPHQCLNSLAYKPFWNNGYPTLTTICNYADTICHVVYIAVLVLQFVPTSNKGITEEGAQVRR